MIIDCLADLHGHYPKLEGGDLLIVAGDLTKAHSKEELLAFIRWLQGQSYTKKVFISGNHDTMLVGPWPGGLKGPFREDKAFYDFDYLCDSGTEFEGLKIWGSPWTPLFEGVNPACTAFMLPEAELEAKFALIPNDTNILITHGPPYQGSIAHPSEEYSRLDKNASGRHVGSTALLKHINPDGGLKLHVFGHVHEGYGIYEECNPIFHTIMVNCSHVNEYYKPVNKPVRIIL